jgi:hypothetical protein
MCLVSGCMTVGDEPTPATIKITTPDGAPQGSAGGGLVKPMREIGGADEVATGPDVCALASELPTTDACSLMCDPPAMADFLLAEGMHSGTCYQLRCTLPTLDSPVNVGVCLAP